LPATAKSWSAPRWRRSHENGKGRWKRVADSC